MCYGTEKHEKEASQLQVPCDNFQVVGGAIPLVAQLLQSAENHTYQIDKEEYRTLHFFLRIRSAARIVSY